MFAETRRHCRPNFESDERLEACAALPSVNEVAPSLKRKKTNQIAQRPVRNERNETKRTNETK